MKINSITQKRAFIGKEFNMKEVIQEEKSISFFKRERYINIIYSSEDTKLRKEYFESDIRDLFVFTFSDKRAFEKNKVFKELEKGVYVHFPKVEHAIALKWFSRELKQRGININETALQSIVLDSEARLTKLNNYVKLFELGTPIENFLPGTEKDLRELDYQSIINIVVSLVRKKLISPEILWKVYDPLLYNRRINYDYELEMKQILRRIYEKRNKY
ncbi:MAG: hypothetical protein ABDH49_07530 [Candidatus Hydrothermales bacterium]